MCHWKPSFLVPLFVLQHQVPKSATMFNRAQNLVVNGGVFVAGSHSSPKAPDGRLERLLDEVAPNAILNAGGRADEVRCYPGTRKEIIGKMERWMDDKSFRTSRMMWLSGPAGAGKSAIFQTVAERCRNRGRHAANFFFFRGDSTRNFAQPLVATLVYQLRCFYPALDERLADCLTATPLICGASTEDQFIQLISEPIQTVLRPPLIWRPIILIIDGLDECNDMRKQEEIVVALHALVKDETSPFRVLVASRAEHHLVMAFNKLGASVESLFLDNEYRPQDDIRRFVFAKFDEIKRVHSLAHTLGEHWPAQADIDKITDKSSGQFIYAATAMRFIQYSPASPALSLLTIHGIQPSSYHSPFAQLDMVYSYIFSKSSDIRRVKLVLGAYFIIERGVPPSDRGQTLGALLRDIAMIEIQSTLADLVAIIKVADADCVELVFYHASLSDYLKDKSRSEIFYVDVEETAAELSIISLKNFRDSGSFTHAIFVLGYVKEASIELSKTLLDASKWRFNADLRIGFSWGGFICTIERLYFTTEKPFFRLLLQGWICFAYANKIDVRKDIDLQSRSAYRYYKLYLVTERVKFALKLTR
ncbi:hypothetical protein D9619_002448 [Psilocybe cf. subviscida]|uniref:NACHT domain-containing protein n=1 Tax=Psilocybe cf. subviscida TaxID=2480587 RepID=A0A8H5AWE4_9AGAR|nr:hypothetical protein D9619_002448 [Psilocybe cf. subviscida]